MIIGWQTKKLMEVCAAVSTGPFGSILHKSDYVDHGVPLVNPINIVDDRIVPDPSKRISNVTKQRLASYVLAEGDIVVARRGEIGRCAVVSPNEAGWLCGTGSFFIRPLPSTDSRFLAQLIRSANYREKLEKASTGTTMKNLSNTALRDLVLDIPPFSEQRRIVGVLDEAFDGIATAKANTEKNLQNARALFESHLESVFTQKGVGWVEKPLAELCALFVDSAHRTPTYQAEGIPAVRPRDVVNGKLALTDTARVSEEEYEIQSKRHGPAPGDIVYSRELSYGWAAVLPESPRVCLSQGMCLFRPTPDLNGTFLLYVLNGPVGRAQATRAAVGTAHPHINLGDIKAYLIPVPPLGTQMQIIRKLDAIVAETQRLESIYQQKLAALDALKKSLLHQAFSGQL